jgi:uncharacterized protein GlcG (DUF336 family)
MLTLFKARKIVNEALQRARELNVSVSVAVCDTSGRLIALNQMDGSRGWEVDRSSMGKAVAAAITGRPSDELFEQFATGAPRLLACNNVVPPRGQRGGLPVVEAGIVQGACGVSGAPRRRDRTKSAQGPASRHPKHLNKQLQPMLTGLRLPSPSRTQPRACIDRELLYLSVKLNTESSCPHRECHLFIQNRIRQMNLIDTCLHVLC